MARVKRLWTIHLTVTQSMRAVFEFRPAFIAPRCTTKPRGGQVFFFRGACASQGQSEPQFHRNPPHDRQRLPPCPDLFQGL